MLDLGEICFLISKRQSWRSFCKVLISSARDVLRALSSYTWRTYHLITPMVSLKDKKVKTELLKVKRAIVGTFHTTSGILPFVLAPRTEFLLANSGSELAVLVQRGFPPPAPPSPVTHKIKCK